MAVGLSYLFGRWSAAPPLDSINNSKVIRDKVCEIDINRLFVKYRVFFQEFSKVCHISLASTRLLLVVQRIGVTVHSHCVESVEGVLKRSWLGKGFSE